MTRAVAGQERSRLPALLAIGAVAGLVLMNWHLMSLEIDISPAAPDAAADAVPLFPLEEPAGVSAEARQAAFPETLARPLFRASRRPFEAPAPKAAAPARTAAPTRVAALPDDLALVGIMKEGDQAGRALIRLGLSPTGQWVEVGHVLDGWRLTRIEPGGILFEADGQQHRLTLFPTGAAD